jgi:hypothetical protein
MAACLSGGREVTRGVAMTPRAGKLRADVYPELAVKAVAVEGHHELPTGELRQRDPARRFSQGPDGLYEPPGRRFCGGAAAST